MKQAIFPLSATILIAALTGCGGSDNDSPPAQPPALASTVKACNTVAFSTLQLTDATLRSATPVAGGSFTPPGSRTAIGNLPEFCRIEGSATPSTDSLVNFEVWVPSAGAWNGKVVVTGNGGYSPQLSYGDMAYAMRQGYAVVGGDTGHQAVDPNEMFWGVGHPEKIKDWGSRSIHAITVPAKSIIADMQARSPSRAYYYGCSTGGHQGYAEIQHYPEDFDGIIAGAPGNNRIRLNIEFMHRFMANRAPNTNGPLILPATKAALVTNAAVAACDEIDGVKDGVITDPRSCTSNRFSVESLACASGDEATCLTPAQIDVVKKIYAGPKNPRTNEQLYPGLPVGSEFGWPGYWGGVEPVRADFWRLWTYDNPQWNWWTFDFDRDVTFADAKLAALVDQVNPDINAFKARGGKAIVYQGWQDPVVNPIDTIAYYEKVRNLQGSQAETDKFFRLFMVPGMGHCSGGTGAANFGNQGAPSPVIDADHDLLMAMNNWVENGATPGSMIASRVQNGNTVRTRPLCAYPKKAVYKGTGSTDEAASFICQ